MSELPTPDKIVADWQRIVASHSHIHTPTIAAMIGVPEAALIAARIGTGATRLIPDLTQVLAPIRGWHRILFVCAPGIGVFMPMDRITDMQTASGHLHLSGDALQVAVALDRVAEVYLFEDRMTGPSHSKTLQAFDAQGDPVIKLVIYHKPSFQAVREWAADLTHADQSREWRGRAPRPLSQATQATPAPGQELVAHMKDLAETGRRAAIEAYGNGSRVAWSGHLTRVRADETWVHLHETTLRAHLNVTGLSVARNEGGRVFDTASGPALRFPESPDLNMIPEVTAWA